MKIVRNKDRTEKELKKNPKKTPKKPMLSEKLGKTFRKPGDYRLHLKDYSKVWKQNMRK